jgi:Methyltransferase domain
MGLSHRGSPSPDFLFAYALMTDAPAPREAFLTQFTTSVNDGTFVKLTLGKPRGPDESVENIFVRPVLLGGQIQLSFVWHRTRNDVTKNHSLMEGGALLGQMLGTDFYSAHLFTPTRTVQLEYNKKGVPRLTTGKAIVIETPEAAHDRKKNRLLPAESQQWLQALGVTTANGAVREGMADKHRQIHKFVEILSHLAAEATLPASRPIEIADMGCGKGYLTFATHDYFNRVLSRPANVQGIEVRPALVEKCNEVARAAGCTRLSFRAGAIQSASFPTLDLLITLHACDTATDDAIVQGIQAGVALIVVAPCCQQEVRSQLVAAPVLAPALHHGIFQERHAEFATDALRALLLEWAGYDTKVFEFISTEHTAKNVMISATKRRGSSRTEAAALHVRELAAFYGIKSQALARHLGFLL